MNTINQLNKFTKTVLLSGLVFFTYGWLCRWAGIYFFWESRTVGFTLLLVGAIGVLSTRIKIKLTTKQKSFIEKIGIGLLVVFLLAQALIAALFPATDAYAAAKKHLRADGKLKKEIGEVIGFSIIPFGSISKTTTSDGEYGAAEINMTIKGETKYKDVVLLVVKHVDTPEWEVQQWE